MNLSPLPIQKFFSNDGIPLASGRLFVYAAGTTTKINSYTDAGGLTANTNPIILDFRGECRLWIDPLLTYKFVLAPPGASDPPSNPIWTVDNVTAAPPPIENSAVDTGSGNSVQLAIATLSGTPTIFDRIVWKSALQNTGNVTISINGGPAKNLLWQNIEPLSAGALQIGGMYEAFYDGTRWQLQGPTLGPREVRTLDEFVAGVTPVDYTYPVGDVRRYGAKGDWNGASGTDDTAAFADASAVINAQGGGTLSLGGRRYRVLTGAAVGPLVDLEDVRGVTIQGDGAEIAVDRTFTGSQTAEVFHFTNCDGIHFSGEIKATCTQIQPAGQKASRGPEFATFREGCKNVTNDSLTVTGFRAGWYMRRELLDPSSFVSSGFDLGVTTANSTGYPLTTAGATGWGVRAWLITDTCTRSYFPQGAVDHEIYVISKNHEASVDCLIANSGTTGMNGLYLNYTNIDSTTADNSVNCVRLEIQDSDLFDVIHRNIEVELNIVTTTLTWLGFGFESGKVRADSTPDPTDRGHIVENVRVHGTIKAGSSNQRGIGFCNTGTWGLGEFVDTIDFSDLRLDGTAQPTFNLASLQRTATFRNCYLSSQANITGNTTGKITLTNCKCDGSFTSSTADTSRMAYIACNFGSLTNQSIINKAFYDCEGLGASYTGNLTGTVGADPTGTIEYTIDGSLVTLKPANIQGTSDAAATLVQGMPPQIRPTSSQVLLARVQNNGVDGIAIVRVETNGDITLFSDVAGNAMAAVGTKGLSAQTLPPYRLR